jgi:hypothetical protein
MAIKPILFNTEMVRTILDGRKGATRRSVKGYIPDDAVWGYTAFTPKGYISCRGTFADGYGGIFFKLPCEPGDILYVRETWFYEHHMENKTEGEPDLPSGRYKNRYIYRADNPNYPVNIGVGAYGWRPSIHMPKEAARIWLKVTDVRVERLQEISEDGAVKEGIYVANCKDCNAPFGCDACPDEGYDEIDEFAELWDSTIKKSDIDRYGWDANPWVWVISFEWCEKPEGV